MNRADVGLVVMLVLGPAGLDAARAAPPTPQGGPGCGGLQTEQAPNGTPLTATPIAQSTSAGFDGIYGTIAAFDADWYRFTAPAGSRVWLSVDTGVAGPAGSRDSVLSLFAADGTTLIEADDDDGTGNGRNFTIESSDASLIAGRVLTAGGTYFARVEAKVPGQVIDGYSLLMAVTTSTPQPELQPNDCPPDGSGSLPTVTGVIAGSLSSAADSDCYAVTLLDAGFPLIVVDGDPERDGIATDINLRFGNLGAPPVMDANSSAAGSLSDPPGEGFAIQWWPGFVRITGTGPGTYVLALLYLGDFCPVPVQLQGFSID